MRKFGKKREEESSLGEKETLLSKKQQNASKVNKCIHKIKKTFRDGNHILLPLQKKNRPPMDLKEITRLINNQQFLEACELISKLDPSNKVDIMYDNIAKEMRKITTLALGGDTTLNSKMNEVATCVKWAKSQEFMEELGSSPKTWNDDLEQLITKHIEKECFPSFSNDTNIGIEQHLQNVQCKISQSINVNRSLLGDLFFMFLKCLVDCLHHHLSTLAKNDFTYQESVLLYTWITDEHKRVWKYQQELNGVDWFSFGKFFIEYGNKIINVGKIMIKKALREILEKEIDWNSNPEPHGVYNFDNIQKELNEVTKPMELVSSTILSELQAICWDEVHYFVARYHNIVQKKVNEKTLGNRFYIALRIIKNCYILRNTTENIGTIPENKISINNDIKARVGLCEDNALRLVCTSLKSTLKKPFQNHFAKKLSEFENKLNQLQRDFEETNISTNKVNLKTIHQTVVTLYIQSFFENYKSVERFLEGSKKLQDAFEALVSEEELLDNPMKYMSQILSDKDTESMKMTIALLSHHHPDIREQHVKLLMDLNENLSSVNKKMLLEYIKNRKESYKDANWCFFKEIKVKTIRERFKSLCCFLFLN